MRSHILVWGLTSLAAIICATYVTAQGSRYPNQSAPFFLKLNSADRDIDGSIIVPVHTGSLRKQLAFAKDSTPHNRDRFYINISDTSQVDGMPTGALVWNFPHREPGPFTGLDHDTSLMAMHSFSTSNVQITSLERSTGGSEIGFDADNKLFIPVRGGNGDGTVPRDQIGSGQKCLYHWHICRNYFNGYNYTSLAWVTGGELVNRSCRAVNVTRACQI